jgi:hypothetical protein
LHHDQSTAGYSPWVGESGILTALATAVFAFLLYRLWPCPRESPREITQVLLFF